MKRTFSGFALASIVATFIGCAPANPTMEADVADELKIEEPSDNETTAGEAPVIETPVSEEKPAEAEVKTEEKPAEAEVKAEEKPAEAEEKTDDKAEASAE